MKDMGVRIAFITQAAPWEANLTFGQFNIDQAAALKRLGAQCEIFAPMMRVPRMLNRFSAAIRRRNSRPRGLSHVR